MPFSTKEKRKNWEIANEDRLKEYRRQNYLRNREKRIAAAKEYQQKNRERVNELERDRYKARGKKRHKRNRGAEKGTSPNVAVVPPVVPVVPVPVVPVPVVPVPVV